MAAFKRTDFNTTEYAASRPIYPQALYDFVFDFHKQSPDARYERAVDLGCGTGQATVELKPFRCVTGVDPSENMVHSAREMLEERNRHVDGGKDDGCDVGRRAGQTIDLVQGFAEKLNFLPDGSTDLVIAGAFGFPVRVPFPSDELMVRYRSAQSCHWFDWFKVWPELARVMRKGATAAFWIYPEFRLPKYPTLTPLMVAYERGTDPGASLGPYWQQPGRDILLNHLTDIPEGNDIVPGAFEPLDRVYFTGEYYPGLPSARPILLRKVMSWEELFAYCRTWSALHTFKERNPSDAAHADGPVEERFFKALREGAAEADGGLSDELEVDWPITVVLARKAI